MTGTLGRLAAQTLASRTGSVHARIAPSFAPMAPLDPLADEAAEGAMRASASASWGEEPSPTYAVPEDSIAPPSPAPADTASPFAMPAFTAQGRPDAVLSSGTPRAVPHAPDPDHVPRDARVAPIERLMGFVADESSGAPSPGGQAAEPVPPRSAPLPSSERLVPAHAETPAAAVASAPSATPPAIEISIGRIEVRADPARERRAPQRSAAPPPASSQRMSLEDYLRGGGRP